jgi:predicted RNA-binding protein with PIN domain
VVLNVKRGVINLRYGGLVNYIIDGHNLIAQLPGLDLSMPDDEERLVVLLNRFGMGKPHRLEVYFDGAPAGLAGVRSYGQVKAHFVRQGQTADEAIRRRLVRLGRSAADWVVVSSDREVQAAAREAHAQAMRSVDFTRLLQASLQARLASDYEGTEKLLSEAEVDEWLKFFKEPHKKP